MGGLEVTLDKQAPLTEEYWRSFVLSDEEIEHLHDLIVEEGIPQTTAFLVYEVVERRCQAEAKAARAEIVPQRVVPYDPRETFRKGQRLLFRRLGIACVTETWSQYDPNFGEYLSMRVRKEDTDRTRVFMAGVKRGFEDYEPAEVEESEGWGLGEAAPYVAPGEVVEQFGNYVREELTNRLGPDERFVNFGEEWFLADLLERVSMQELTLVEKRIREAGEPLKLAALVDVPDEPQTDEDFVRRFSCDYALAEDGRFDNVGTVDAPLWFLLALEPPEVVSKPECLAIPAVAYTREYVYIHKDLEKVARGLDDEGEEKEPPPIEFIQTREPVRFVLNFAHLTAGSVPLTNRIRQVFPRPAGPRSRVILVDARSETRLAGWVKHDDRYAWGLKEWYGAYGIRAGNYVILQATETPTEIRVDFDELSQPRVERVRVATRGKDGSWRFEWQEREVRYKHDPLMFIAETRFEEMESLEWEAGIVGKPIFEVMCDLFPALAESEGDTVHAKTLYQAVNLVRRCAPATVFGELSQRVCFDPVGDGYWAYDESQRDVKVVYGKPAHMEIRPRSRRRERVKSYVIRRKPVRYKIGEFEGFLDTDFKEDVTGTHWRAELGHALRDLLNQEFTELFKSSPIRGWPEVYLYHEGHDVIYKHAKFHIKLDGDSAQAGFYVERGFTDPHADDRPEAIMDPSWDWYAFRRALDSKAFRKVIVDAIEGQSIRVRVSLESAPAVYGSAEGSLILDPDGEGKLTTWDALIGRLDSAGPRDWVDLYFYRVFSKSEALALGRSFVEEAMEVFAALRPVYEETTQLTPPPLPPTEGVWGEVGKLVGHEGLTTLDQQNPFRILEVSETSLQILVGRTGHRRTIRREEIEDAWQHLVSQRELSRSEIHAHYSEVNPAYVAAILAALPGVTHKTDPIRLFYSIVPPSVEVPDIGIRHIVYPIPFVAGELPEQFFEESAWDKLIGGGQLSLWQRTWTREALDEALVKLIADRDANRFVTTREVVDFMVNLAQPKPDERVADICCGTGIFLVKALRFVKEVYGEDTDLELYGADIYEGAVEAARLNLLANGARNFTVVQADSLKEQEGIFDAKYDLILGNPPFSGRQDRAFLRRWATLLRSASRLVVNVSDGILANSGHTDQELRHWIVSNFELESVVSLPRPKDSNLYGAKTNALLLRDLSVDASHRAVLISIEAYTELPVVLQTAQRRNLK